MHGVAGFGVVLMAGAFLGTIGGEGARDEFSAVTFEVPDGPSASNPFEIAPGLTFGSKTAPFGAEHDMNGLTSAVLRSAQGTDSATPINLTACEIRLTTEGRPDARILCQGNARNMDFGIEPLPAGPNWGPNGIFCTNCTVTLNGTQTVLGGGLALVTANGQGITITGDAGTGNVFNLTGNGLTLQLGADGSTNNTGTITGNNSRIILNGDPDQNKDLAILADNATITISSSGSGTGDFNDRATITGDGGAITITGGTGQFSGRNNDDLTVSGESASITINGGSGKNSGKDNDFKQASGPGSSITINGGSGEDSGSDNNSNVASGQGANVTINGGAGPTSGGLNDSNTVNGNNSSLTLNETVDNDGTTVPTDNTHDVLP